MLEEVHHEWGVEVREGQGRGHLARASLGEGEEELEGVAVALDGASAHASLLDESTEKEVLDKGGEVNGSRSHRPPPWLPRAPNRSATTPISSGVALKYQ